MVSREQRQRELSTRDKSAMLPMRFSSVRQKSRSGLGRPSFRDDTGLVALRYEKTKPAAPPVPLPPARHLLRAASVASTRSNTASSTRTTRSSSSSISSSSNSPIIVAPPSGYLLGIAPPTEQHPALRSPMPATGRAFDDYWKRDSGHAPTTTSSTTIHEEDCEDDEDDGLRAKLDALATSGGAAPAVQLVENRPVDGRASSDGSPTLGDKTAVRVGAATAAGPLPTTPNSLSSSSQSHPRDTPHPRPSSLRKLVKRNSSRLSNSHQQARQLSEESDSGPGQVAPMQPQPLLRGSRSPASATQQQPRPPTSSPQCRTAIPSGSPTPDASSTADNDAQYSPLAIAIPTDSLIDDDFMAGFSFSKRGSIMFGGRRATTLDGATDQPSAGRDAPPSLSQTESSMSTERLGSEVSTADTVTRSLMAPPDIRILSADVEKESQKLQGSLRRETELAGGLEDWEDINGADVDRYGFISTPRPASRMSTPTELRSAQFSPRRKHVLQKRDPMGFSPQLGGGRMPSRKVSARSLNTQNSEMSVASVRSSRSVMRQASNLLPHNRNRRWMDEAGDMLTVSPSLQDLVEEARIEKISEELKRKEWERSEKWRKMAKVVGNGDEGQGQGMEFEFDVKNPKLIERTWKGIPDRWRAAAWWSFLASAAKEHEGSPSAEDIVATFHRLLGRSSPDDVQIDLDVPRTINRHIMFRRRYRGGQRLLFRVLHALSIYFPETGYVQGMASLAATLLCYFDEEKCFVMLVRMWQLRGLDRLYRPGFEGLMAALREFETGWLNKDVANNLSELGVDSTAYGTRWYLTLFNLSIPFPAQLRVWDVFLLFNPCADQSHAQHPQAARGGDDASAPTPASGLDVLHATGAAVVQALREVLIDSDFENAMKALTSWIPIKDEDLLMKVTKAEWRTHQGKKKT
ncbi:TBC domain-containing protein [Tolypocladium paradoxum]|uniref:TBC domain-containing protein n=1 Tax=Tolypocladium paradoxum TaxID=94208 RepID=A0A2S4L6D0_9HYPO|nr:TBC domain-containing protein [Tolypocladium paradoxum]